MKQNWLVLIFFFILPFISTAIEQSNEYKCSVFNISHDPSIHEKWDLETGYWNAEKESNICKFGCVLYLCYNYETKMLVYGSSCYDQTFSDMCNLNQTIKSVPLGFFCEADENNFMWLFQSCNESSSACFNNFNECAQAQEKKHDSIGNLEWKNIVLVQDLNLKPTISNLSQETTIIISSSTTTKSSTSITLPPKTESQNEENVWKTECVSENCKEAMKFAEENGNSSNGFKNYYSFFAFLGIIFIKFLIRFL